MSLENRTATFSSAIVTTPRADELVVNWPDPSPLHDWWAEVMTGKAGTDRVADAA